MLTRTNKESIVKDLTSITKESKILVIADFRGLSVKDMSDLKKLVKEVNGKMKVVRKTLVNLALKANGIEYDVRKHEGPLVFIFGEEEVGVPKKVWEFAKKSKKLKIESGILEKKLIDAKSIEALAKLPGKEQLLAKLVGTIQAPVSSFVYVLSGTVGSLVNVIKAINDKKSENK